MSECIEKQSHLQAAVINAAAAAAAERARATEARKKRTQQQYRQTRRHTGAARPCECSVAVCVAARVRMGVCITQLHPSPASVHDFLNAEARRERARVCECGRAREPSAHGADSVCGCCGTGSTSAMCVLGAARAALASVLRT